MPLLPVRVMLRLFTWLNKWMYILSTINRDFRGLVSYFRLLLKMSYITRNNLCVPKLFEKTVYKKRDKIAFYFENESWTFLQVDAFSNKIGNYFADKGVEQGDVIGILMKNSVKYICIWLGLSKIGAIPALINSSLRLNSLKTCITVASCKAIIYEAELQQAISDILDDDDDEGVSSLPLYVCGADERELTIKDCVDLDADVGDAAITSPPQLKNINITDSMMYIYTSGTTGLPKPAIIKHSRFLNFTCGAYYLASFSPRDVIYNPLPLYHSSGGIMGTGQALLFGCSVVLKRKFSASEYWTDVIKYRATIGLYIGEVGRYLLNTPSKPEDTGHKIRLMFGNGLRQSIWKDFMKRFHIPKICEFYGSTEGNVNTVNTNGKTGSVGFIPLFLQSTFHMALLKIDDETQEVVRTSNGLCIRCKPGECGVLIGRIKMNHPIQGFEGYVDEEATQKSIIRNVFKVGDSAFLSGDLLKMDMRGYLYFVDRLGENFRWKGENISALEIEDVVSKFAGHTDVAVYGVEIPGNEGRCGMAAIADPEGTLDLAELYICIERSLAPYACPLFIRLAKQLEKTDTFRVKKTVLQKEGYNPNTISDQLYFKDSSSKAFVPLTTSLYNKIINGKIKL
ncbi:long-chain fatty acid transport protein 4 isoform X2 [Procambarus clarkii]|uniref:long-chain fatty acid transport protein 4 isoform X2 n=1 Tax=Procambarus clarkii TaxID=6728 RepID=UPI003744671C